jgi:hypothetical protein
MPAPSTTSKPSSTHLRVPVSSPAPFHRPSHSSNAHLPPRAGKESEY